MCDLLRRCGVIGPVWLASFLMLVFVPSGWSAGTPEPAPEPAITEEEIAPDEIELSARHPVGGLIGGPVVDNAGDEIGTIDEVLIDLTTGTITHLVLHLVNGDSDARYPIPIYLVYPHPDTDGVRFPVEDLNVLAWAPRMADYPPETRATAWHRDVDEYWRQSDAMVHVRPLSPGHRLGVDEQTIELGHQRRASGMAVAQGLIEESSTISDLAVVDDEGERVATVVDYVVDLGSGHVSYALVALDDRELRPVPLPLLVRRLDLDSYTFRGTADHLASAPGFQEADGLSGESVAQLRDREWELEAMGYWTDIDVNVWFQYGARVVPGLTLDLTTFLAHRLVNVHNRPIGDIADVIIGRDGVVMYVEVTFGGFLGLGETRFAIPITAVTADPYGEVIVLDLGRDELEQIPPLTVEMLPTDRDDWDADIRAYWHQRIADVAGEAAAAAFDEADADRDHGGAIRAQSVLGYRVMTEAEEEGTITDLLIDVDQPAVAFVVVEFPADNDDDVMLIPVPVGRLSFDADEELARLDASEQELRDAPSYPIGLHPVALQGQAWMSDVRGYWEAEGS
jgi:sporulation protein YlmC with PRC-barrel domain